MEEHDDYFARLDGTATVLWEPLWRVRTELRLVERVLLACWPLRRLHFVSHSGGSALTTHHVHSRLQHTLGVFSLVAHFCPDDDVLRVAALLHDVGHAPFSHALEQLDGVDHHRWTVERILSSPVADILTRHGLKPRSVSACVDGDPASILKNRDGILHADHLDSWVRSAQAGGILPRPAREILARLHLVGPHLETDVETAELLVDLIVAEARFHCSAANLGPNMMLARLAQRLSDAGAVAPEELATMTDAEVERRLFETSTTREEAKWLWYRPDAIVVRRLVGDDAPPDAYIVRMDHLYLAMPLVDGQDVTRVSSRAADLLSQARQLRGTYAVYWKMRKGFSTDK
jgi:HD superfamily phosphohydrolase